VSASGVISSQGPKSGNNILAESSDSEDDVGIPMALLRQLSGDGTRLVAVLTEALFQAYLDEGGTHSGSPILSVAGYYGIHEQWATFLRQWPHTEFHAKEAKYDYLKPSLADAIDTALLAGT